MARARVIVTWILQLLLTVAFVPIGLGKLSGPGWERSFVRWGFPHGFHLVIGSIEALCGVLLLVPRLTSYAASLLIVVMIGAVATHASAGESPWRPLPHLVLLFVVASMRWRDRWRPRGVVPGSPEPSRTS